MSSMLGSDLSRAPKAGCSLSWPGIGFFSYETTARRIVILAIVLLMPAYWRLHPMIFDPDIWWHLRTGQWIVEHGAIPSTDPFSSYGMGKPWVPYSWLFEVFMSWLYDVWGLVGLVFYPAVMGAAVLGMTYHLVARRQPNPVLAAGLTALAGMAMAKVMTPRPWLFTILFFAITLDLVLAVREGRRTRGVWCLPMLFALWANIHIQFVYGLLLLGLACTAAILDPLLTRTRLRAYIQPANPSATGTWLALTVACVVATLLNPAHVKLYAVIADLGAQTGMYEYTQELVAPGFRIPGDWVMLGLGTAAVFALGARRTWSSFDFLLCAAAAYFSFRSSRDVWFLVLTALAILATREERGRGRAEFAWTRPRLLALGILLASGLVVLTQLRAISEDRVREGTAKLYPVQAAAVIEQQGLRGPLYNHFDWGGYLLWRLPWLPVSMDGRANVHGDARIIRSLETWSGKRAWERDPELEQARLVVAHRESALASLLRLDGRTTLVHEDDTAALFVRRRDPETGQAQDNRNSHHPPSVPAIAAAGPRF